MGDNGYMKAVHCHNCNQKLCNDEIALNLKLLGKQTGTFHCSRCLSAYLGCDTGKLKEITDYYKYSGCILFQTTYTD